MLAGANREPVSGSRRGWQRAGSGGMERRMEMKRNASVYLRGKIEHPDHQTVVLNGWHRVLMNTENRSVAMRFLAFLD